VSEAYKQAGVDIAAGNEAVERIRPHVRRTFRPEVLADLGGFGGLFRLDKHKYEDPVLVAGADGVGTKLKIAFAADRHDTIGVDAVAMCVNDVVVQGAEPLFFLDYLACGRLDPAKVEAIVKGVADGCAEAGCALIGGETAEMPGMYAEGEYDLAGFAVGVVDRKNLVTGEDVRPGDVLLGLASSGLHSNGFSLVRKLLIDSGKYDLYAPVPELGPQPLVDVLLAPTRIYVRPLLALMKRVRVRAMAHITGGGFLENIPRVLPDGLEARIEYGTWPVPPIFELLAREGGLSGRDLFSTFNMGVGMVVVVREEDADAAAACLAENGERVFRIGRVVEGTRRTTIVGVEL